jgi:hypothetical protein
MRFVFRTTPKDAHYKKSNTWTVLIVHTVVSLLEGFTSCLTRVCCGDCGKGRGGGGCLAVTLLLTGCKWPVKSGHRTPFVTYFSFSCFFLLFSSILLYSPSSFQTKYFTNPSSSCRLHDLVHPCTLQPLSNNKYIITYLL